MEVELPLPSGGDEGGEGVVGIPAIRDQAQPPRHPRDVRVHGEERAVEPEEEHHVRRLLPHPGQGEEPTRCLLVRELGEEVERERPSLALEPLQDLLQAPRPLAVEARPLDRLRDLPFRGGEDVLPPREPAAELGVGVVAVAVGRVLGKNGSHEEVEGSLAPAGGGGAEPEAEPPCRLSEARMGSHGSEG